MAHSNKPNPKIFVMFHGGRNVAILREQCTTYEDILAVVKSTFKSLEDAPSEEIIIKADYPYELALVEYSEPTWPHVSNLVSRVIVERKEANSESH